MVRYTMQVTNCLPLDGVKYFWVSKVIPLAPKVTHGYGRWVSTRQPLKPEASTSMTSHMNNTLAEPSINFRFIYSNVLMVVAASNFDEYPQAVEVQRSRPVFFTKGFLLAYQTNSPAA